MLNRPGVRLLAATVLVFGGLWLHELVQTLARPPLIIDIVGGMGLAGISVWATGPRLNFRFRS